MPRSRLHNGSVPRNSPLFMSASSFPDLPHIVALRSYSCLSSLFAPCQISSLSPHLPSSSSVATASSFAHVLVLRILLFGAGFHPLFSSRALSLPHAHLLVHSP